jgi:peptide/nickel transport system permease protein
MWIYLIKRTALAVVIIITAISLLYSMILMVPGDPTAVILGPRSTPEMREALRADMGLDRPAIIQVAGFILNVFQGDMGIDVFTNRPVSQIVFEQLPYTVILIMAGISWAIVLGIPLGCYSAIYRNSFIDKLTGIFSVGTIAIPAFVIALYGLLLFAVHLKWLPAIGAGEAGDLWDQIRHLILPAFAIGLGWVGYLARLVRASMLEVLGENHIRTVRAFGLPEKIIIFRYALKLAILPTIALLGVGVGYLLSASVFAEIVFARPGIGKLIYESVLTRNYPIIMGSVLITTIIFVLCTMLADIVNALLDPRMRESL